ncbi:glycosyltransferase family 2 protein [Paraburkholderia sp. C35]|uniref:glycosyltransferase family 2 protein n=1 Tax=Paraburkholderia sp. C35 TaxID=2126993 RepID=UPI000D6982F4|nr:glycosyltransferase family 2 protein [Paraburkholderia sp. C35]
MTTFSIIVPVYNVEHFLQETLDCIAAQIFTDFEVILIDDGSTDRSGAIARDFCRLNSRFTYSARNNQGVSSARNAGTDLATGEYLYYMDADDKIVPDMLERCYASLKAHNADIVLFDADVFPIQSPDYPLYKGYYRRPAVASPLPSGEVLAESVAQNRFFTSPCCYIARRDVIGHLRFIEGMVFEDNHFFVALLTERSLRVTVLPQPLFQRRLRSDSITSGRKNRHHYDSMHRLLKETIALPFSAVPRQHRASVRVSLVDGQLRSIPSISYEAGITPALRLRNLAALWYAATRVSSRFLSARRIAISLFPELRQLKQRSARAGFSVGHSITDGRQ